MARQPGLRTITLLLLLFTFCTLIFAQADSTCSSSRPCKLGCCSNSGNCGYGPSFCGAGNCTSNCDAKAECGQYADPSKTKCPLNVCCSQYGFCGTTSAFCGTGCQNGCATPQAPACGAGGNMQKQIGYYESWAYNRKCDAVAPEGIEAGLWTHLNYAFALINPSTFQIASMNSFDAELWPRFTALKLKNPALKTYISIGGWDAGGKIFSDMMSSSSTRSAFILSALKFCRQYGFDGIDIDWEYPVADDRGGAQKDFANFVTFMKELKAAFGTLGATITLPASYWYLQGFDIKNLEPNVDWFNMMTYDIHGLWDGNNPYTQRVVNPHTNLTEINDGLNLLWRNNISPSKVVLGLGFYGRSFALSSPSCNTPGCAFKGGANPGECTGTSGVLSNNEIRRIIQAKGLKPTLDTKAAVKYVSWDSDQWVSYDDADTLKMKTDYASKLCLAGTMVWAIDLDSSDAISAQYLSSKGTMANSKGFSQKRMLFTGMQRTISAIGVWTPCLSDKQRRNQPCPSGYHPIGMAGHGNVFDYDRYKEISGCKGGNNRELCIADAVITRKCQWNRDGKGGKFCDSGCPSGTYVLSQNTQPAGDRTACAHGSYIAICCEGFDWAGNTCPVNPWYDVFGGGMAAGSRLTVPSTGSLKKRSDGSEYYGDDDYIPIGDEGADDLNERQGEDSTEETSTDVNDPSAEESKKRKKKRQNYSDPYLQPCYDYYPALSNDYVTAKVGMMFYGSDGSAAITGVWSASKQTVTSTSAPITRGATSTFYRTCDGAFYPQPCAHYRSVASRWDHARHPLCPGNAEDRATGDRNLWPELWDETHDKAWSSWIIKSYMNPKSRIYKKISCQRDEWPPYAVFRHRPGQEAYIRFLPGSENSGVANDARSNWKNICQWPLKSSTEVNIIRTDYGVFADTVWIRRTSTLTTNRLHMDYTNMPVTAGDPHLLTANDCWPRTLVPNAEPGYALLADDYYYGGSLGPYSYGSPPQAQWTNGKTQPTKRGLDLKVDDLRFDAEHEIVIVDDGNSTRPASPDELHSLGMMKCQDSECKGEMKQMRKEYEAVNSAYLAGLGVEPVSGSLTSEIPVTQTYNVGVSRATETSAVNADADAEGESSWVHPPSRRRGSAYTGSTATATNVAAAATPQVERAAAHRHRRHAHHHGHPHGGVHGGR